MEAELDLQIQTENETSCTTSRRSHATSQVRDTTHLE